MSDPKHLLTPEENRQFESFQGWLKELFNAQGVIVRSPMAFTATPHVDATGGILIDQGRMSLEIERGASHTIYVITALGGLPAQVVRTNSLHLALLEALLFSIKIHFVINHKS